MLAKSQTPPAVLAVSPVVALPSDYYATQPILGLWKQGSQLDDLQRRSKPVCRQPAEIPGRLIMEPGTQKWENR
jgi:hypothetical protein